MNWIIFRPDSTFEWKIKMYRTELILYGIKTTMTGCNTNVGVLYKPEAPISPWFALSQLIKLVKRQNISMLYVDKVWHLCHRETPSIKGVQNPLSECWGGRGHIWEAWEVMQPVWKIIRLFNWYGITRVQNRPGGQKLYRVVINE